MTDWTAGYTTNIMYTYGYYAELNPNRIKLAFLNSGLMWPKTGVACELGFGQGLSANIHAAATVVKWYGTDFIPSQAGFAQDLALESGADIRLYDDAFDDFFKRTDLPDFDFICLHGIWSWISDKNRLNIVDFIRRKLKVGGVVYISYNTLPGWSSFAPMRFLLNEHANYFSARGLGQANRIDGAIDFVKKLLSTNPVFAKVNSAAVERLQLVEKQDRSYLAHEYFNLDWSPMYFTEVAQLLEGSKLQYACSAHYLDHIDALNITEDQKVLLNNIEDQNFKQTVRDFLINQQFRRDYWVKGKRVINNFQRTEALRAVKVILIIHRPSASLKIMGALGEASMSERIYNPILDSLEKHEIKSIAELEADLKSAGFMFSFEEIVQSIVILAGVGYLGLVQEAEVINMAKIKTDKLNAYLIERSKTSSDINFLASPVTGGGYHCDRFQQLFIGAIKDGITEISELAEYVWDIISSQGQRLIKDGRKIESAEDNIAELKLQAGTFKSNQLPIIKSIGIA